MKKQHLTESEIMRKYSNIVAEAQESAQLNEGMMDMLKPAVQKLGKWLMSKIDPQTAQQLKQAYDQAGGDKDKFMSIIGITKDDIAKIAPPPSGQQVSAQQQPPQMNEWLSAGENPDAPLKVKILNLLVNGIPLTGILTLGAAMLGASIPTSWPFIIWYVVSAAMIWGVGSYEFSDAFDKDTIPPEQRSITDKYGRSYYTDAGHRKAANDYADRLRAQGKYPEIKK
jgi:hypothetical protein